MYMRSILFLLLFFFSVHSLFAQATRSDPSDVQGWFGATIGADLPKRWKAELDYQARYNNNLTTFNGSYYSVGVERRVTKFLSLSTEYRLSKVLKGTYNRYSFGFLLNRKLGNFKVDARVLYQNQIQDYDDPTKETDKNNFARVRLRVKVPISNQADLLLSTEPIYGISPVVQIDNYRHQVAFRFKVIKGFSLDFFYINRPDYAKKYKRQYHIIGSGLIYHFKVG